MSLDDNDKCEEWKKHMQDISYVPAADYAYLFPNVFNVREIQDGVKAMNDKEARIKASLDEITEVKSKMGWKYKVKIEPVSENYFHILGAQAVAIRDAMNFINGEKYDSRRGEIMNDKEVKGGSIKYSDYIESEVNQRVQGQLDKANNISDSRTCSLIREDAGIYYKNLIHVINLNKAIIDDRLGMASRDNDVIRKSINKLVIMVGTVLGLTFMGVIGYFTGVL